MCSVAPQGKGNGGSTWSSLCLKEHKHKRGGKKKKKKVLFVTKGMKDHSLNQLLHYNTDQSYSSYSWHETEMTSNEGVEAVLITSKLHSLACGAPPQPRAELLRASAKGPSYDPQRCCPNRRASFTFPNNLSQKCFASTRSWPQLCAKISPRRWGNVYHHNTEIWEPRWSSFFWGEGQERDLPFSLQRPCHQKNQSPDKLQVTKSIMQHKEFLFDLQFSHLLRYIIVFSQLEQSLFARFETCNVFTQIPFPSFQSSKICLWLSPQ